MSSVNKAIILGRLGRDPEVRYSPDGKASATLAVATARKWKSKDGQQNEETEWHRVVVYDKLAEICGQYLKKGSAAYFEGRLKTRKWADKDGVERYTTEIIAQEMTMLGGGEGRNEPAKTVQKPAARSGTGFDDMNDDIPF